MRRCVFPTEHLPESLRSKKLAVPPVSHGFHELGAFMEEHGPIPRFPVRVMCFHDGCTAPLWSENHMRAHCNGGSHQCLYLRDRWEEGACAIDRS